MTSEERVRALLNNIGSWSWDVFPKFAMDKEDAIALRNYFRNDPKMKGVFFADQECKNSGDEQMTSMEQKILATYEYFDDNDVSTERLYALVADDCDCSVDEVAAVIVKYAQ